MQSNQYILSRLQQKADIIEAKPLAERTDGDKKTLQGLNRYIDYVSGVQFKINASEIYKCITPQKPLSYWGCGPYIAHCLFGGNKTTWNGILTKMGYKLSNKNKNKNKNKPKKRPKTKKNYKRQTRAIKKHNKNAKAKKKTILFTTSHTSWHKFKNKYTKISPVTINGNKYGPRPHGVAKNLDLCSIVKDKDEDPEEDAYNQMENVASVMKINIAAFYVADSNGIVCRPDLKWKAPHVWGKSWQIRKPVINYASSYMLLEPTEEDGVFKLNKHFKKMMNDWSKWKENKWRNILLDNSKQCDESSSESDDSDNSGNEDEQSKDESEYSNHDNRIESEDESEHSNENDINDVIEKPVQDKQEEEKKII